LHRQNAICHLQKLSEKQYSFPIDSAAFLLDEHDKRLHVPSTMAMKAG